MKKRSFLDQALHEATLKERQRIIKLLEEWLNYDNGDFGDTLKLIKGETK
jgi:hypothetical protein